MRYRARTDASHAAIMAALRKGGWRVFDTSGVGRGFPDLVIYRVGSPIRLVEVKEKGGVITQAQEEFMADGWPVMIVRGVEDALREFCGAVRL